MSSERMPRACPQCLRRARLLAHLAPYVERLVAAAPGTRPPELFALADRDLAVRVAPKEAEQILAQVEAIPEGRLRSELEAAGCWGCCRHDEHFPASLAESADAPWALLGRGDPALLVELGGRQAVSIVGSRRATHYGREVARELGRELGGAGHLVISGLAFGVDSCAHRGALEAGRTVAVLGCGPDVAYPAAHRSLWRQIGESGLVLSELPPGTGAWRWTFPARNRIVAALGAITIVVEAAERSGSMITAELARTRGRILGAVPGPVGSRNSAGPNSLLAAGAVLIRDGADVQRALARAEGRASAPRLERS